jgi:hypothetical protein
MGSFLKGPKDLQYAIVVLQVGSTVISPSVGNSSGSFAIFAAIRRASSFVSRLAAVRRPCSISK